MEPKLFRVRQKPDDYFNYDFTEDSYHCVAMRDLKLESRLYGYIPRGSAVMDGLRALSADRKGIDFAIVKFKAPTIKAGKNQVEITEVLQQGWVLGLDE